MLVAVVSLSEIPSGLLFHLILARLVSNLSFLTSSALIEDLIPIQTDDEGTSPLNSRLRLLLLVLNSLENLRLLLLLKFTVSWLINLEVNSSLLVSWRVAKLSEVNDHINLDAFVFTQFSQLLSVELSCPGIVASLHSF